MFTNKEDIEGNSIDCSEMNDVKITKQMKLINIFFIIILNSINILLF
jgi:hypothetical protein